MTGITLPPRVYEIAAVLLVFYAMYLAWCDERIEVGKLRNQAVKAAAKMRAGPVAALQIEYGNEPCVVITNEGCERSMRQGEPTERLPRSLVFII